MDCVAAHWERHCECRCSLLCPLWSYLVLSLSTSWAAASVWCFLRTEVAFLYLTLGVYEEKAIHYALSRAFLHPSPHPHCRDGWNMPCYEAEMICSLAGFLLAHQVAARGWRVSLSKLFALSLAALCTYGTWACGACSGWQVALGAAVGLLNGVRRVAFFRAFLLPHLDGLLRSPLAVRFGLGDTVWRNKR